MFLFLLSALFVICISSSSVSMCPVPRDYLLSCIQHFCDPTLSGSISPASIDAFLNTQRGAGAAACVPQPLLSHISGAIIVRDCDVNHDGLLTIDDWNRGMSCLIKQNHQKYFCTLCEKCGYSFVPLKKKRTNLRKYIKRRI